MLFYKEVVPLVMPIVVILLCLFSKPLFANNIEGDNPKNALGASVGWLPGNGLSYRRYFGDQFIQGTFVARINRSNSDSRFKDDGQEYLDIGIVYGSYLHYVKNKKLFAPTGLKWTTGIEYFHYIDKYSYECPRFDESCTPGLVITNKDGKNSLYIGAGIGLDIGYIKRKGLLVSIDLNYFVSYDFLGDILEVGPGAELGLLYNY